jgi:hypothetical protein
MVVDRLRAFVEEVRSGSFASCDVPEAWLLLDELELVWLEALGVADGEGLGSERGARSMAAWLALPTTMQRSELWVG